MKPTIEDLKDTFEYSYNVFSESKQEALKVLDLYHNRQYTDSQLAVLDNRGQPKETFNVIKLYARMLIGYYSTLVNTVKANPKQEDDIATSAVLNDIIDYIFEDNNFNVEGDKLKLDLILTGLMCSYVDVQPRGDKDEFGRPKYDIKINHVPSLEIVIDPLSRLEDYSDARFIHRFKWLPKEAVIESFGKAVVDKLEAYYNHLEIDEAEFEHTYLERFTGKYRIHDNYLIVHSVIQDDKGDSWSVFWNGDTILDKSKVTYKKVPNPYRVHKLHTSNRAEYYGIFREVIETQHAINQALLKIQVMVNTQKAFVEESAVENLADFTTQFNRVNAIIPVKDLQGIRIENLSKEVADQYLIIDRALDRIQRLLYINDSFLGMAYASDSGKKVQLQQNAAMVALRYITSKLEHFYRLLGWDILNLVQQYYTFHDVLRIADAYTGNRWIEINKPIEMPTGKIDPNTGMPEMYTPMEQVYDPASGEELADEDGYLVMAPIPTADTDIAFTKADISVESVSYNDELERSQIVLEQFLNGPVGNMLSQIDPVGYFKAAELAIKNTKSKYSIDLAGIINQAAAKLEQNQMAQQQMMMGQVPGQRTSDEAMNQAPGRARQGRA